MLMVHNWQIFKVFQQAPLMDYSDPLEDGEELKRLFVELNNIEIKREIFDLKESPQSLKTIFGKKMLILGDFKVGKTSLKNYIKYQLKNSFRILSVDINVSMIKKLEGIEKIRLNLYDQWYRNLCQEIGVEIKNYSKPIELIEEIVKIYERVFSKDQYDYSIVVLDQANLLENTEEVNPFRDFCEIFQGTWEQNFKKKIRSKILILCIGNRLWINDFELDHGKSFGVFTDWILYGENWDSFTLKEVLKRRILYALKPENHNYVNFLVSEKLISKLEEKAGNSIHDWIKHFDIYLTEFGQQFSYYGNEIQNFDNYLDSTYLLKEKIHKLIEKYKLKGVFKDLRKCYEKIGPESFEDLIKFIEMIESKRTLSKGNLRGMIQKKFSKITYDLIVDELSLGKNGEKHEQYNNPPFLTTKDNLEIMLKENLFELLKVIEKRMQKKPSQFIEVYVKSLYPVSKKNFQDGILSVLGKIKKTLSQISMNSNDILNINLSYFEKNIMSLWKKIEYEENQVKKNILLLKLNENLIKSIRFLMDTIIQLYKITDSPSEIQDNQEKYLVLDSTYYDYFTQFMQNIKAPKDNFDYNFWVEFDGKNVSKSKDFIRNYLIFVNKLLSNLTNFDSESPISQHGVLSKIKNQIRTGIFWFVDIPNQHHFDINKALKYIDENIRKNKEDLTTWAFYPEAYQNKDDKCYDFYKKYIHESGFVPKFIPKKEKKEDMDAFLVQEVMKEIMRENYRCIIIGMADENSIKLIDMIKKFRTNIPICCFFTEIFDYSKQKFHKKYGEESCNEMIKLFSTIHQSYKSSKFRGILRKHKRQPNSGIKDLYKISYAENGIPLNLILSPNYITKNNEKLTTLQNGKNLVVYFEKMINNEILLLDDPKEINRLKRYEKE